MIDVGEWLASRSPAPPADLSNRMSSLVGAKQCADESEMAALFIHAAAGLLASLSDDRLAAYDLLTADALVTYAMEASADDPSRLDAAASLAMQALSAVSSRGGQA